MPWWLTLALFVAVTVIGELFRPKIQDDTPQASGLGDFKLPTADATRPIPAVFGTVLVRGANVVWYGDLVVKPITKKVKTGLFTSETITIGYKYFLGIQMALCHGVVDVFRGLTFADKVPAITTSTVGDRLKIDMGPRTYQLFTTPNPNHQLFGGNEREGGVGGVIDFHYGLGSQTQNAYLQGELGTDIPAYNHVCYAVLNQCYLGTSPYIKEIAFEISRYPNGLGLTASKHIINTYDANPACMIYEALVDSIWGCGMPSGAIDITSFQAVGNALHAEGFGLSMTLDQTATAEQVVSEILRHIDGVLYTDLATGLINIVIARADYVVGSLPTLDDTDVLDVELSRASWDQLTSVVQVQYVSREDEYTPRIAQQQNLALIQVMSGERVTAKFPFLAVSTAELANLICARVLKTVSYPIARVKVVVNRRAHAYRPGTLFKLTWPPLGIVNMVCRVNAPEMGDLQDGRITLNAVEDIFGIAGTAYTPPGGSGWTDPIGPPAAVTAQTMIEAPYHLVGTALAERHALVAAVRSGGSDVAYEIWSDRLGGTAYVPTAMGYQFTASGLIGGATYPKNTTALHVAGFQITSHTDADALANVTEDEFRGGVNLVLVDNEIMAFKTVLDNGDGTYQIKDVLRGVLDTVPADHAVGARAYFIMPPGAAVVDPLNPYSADGPLTAKLLPLNSRSVLPLASATQLALTLASRAFKPYPPGNVKIAGTAYPTSVTVGADIAVTWAHRHRVTQLADLIMVAQDAASYVAAPEGDYTIEVRVGPAGGTLKRTVPAIAGTSWTWTAAMQTTDAATVGATVGIRVIPVNGTLVGTYQERIFTAA